MASTSASIQERLQLKRVPLDDWSIKEKLGLASAVLCSGDQNWMSVSRSLKSLGDASRPADWFSQKSCAAQYGKLLENVETPKRKKRTLSERDSSTPVETPGESIVRKLTQERIVELQEIMLEEQKQFQKLRDEIILLQSPHVSDDQIRGMAAQIEDEKKQQEVEKANHAEFLRKREQRKIEIERAWRPGIMLKNATLLNKHQKQRNDESIESDESYSRNSTGQSPLLTSLLKSSSSTSNVNASHPNLMHTNTETTNSNTPESYVSASQLTVTQSTLSMLLDNNKVVENNSTDGHQTQNLQQSDDHHHRLEIFPEHMSSVESTDNVNDTKDDEQLMEVFKGLIPDNIDELADILTENNTLLNPELLEEEEILNEVMEQAEAQQNQQTSKLDTFDQLKHETLMEEQNKKDAATLKTLMGEQHKKDSAELNPLTTDIISISPEDSNMEDDLPLKVIQKDMQDAKKAQSHTHQNVSKENSNDKNEANTGENSILDINYSTNHQTNDKNLLNRKTTELVNNSENNEIEKNDCFIKTETEEKMDLEFEDKPLPRTIPIIKTELEDSSVDEMLTLNLKTSDKKVSSEDEEIFEDAKEMVTSETSNRALNTDTDEETDILEKDDNRTRARRDYSRKRQEPGTPIKFERSAKQESDRSDSPLVIDDDSDNAPRTRRRYSTPVSDSPIPGSPSSIVEDKEQKVWRKLILLAYGRISSHKNAAVFSFLSTKDSQEKRYKDLIIRPMDMSTIKKHIESGIIKTTNEFQRDIMLMCTNIMLITAPNSTMNQQAKEMMAESISIIKITMDGWRDKEIIEKNSVSSSSVNKRGNRKSLRGT
ncbi:probable E3 ubiquitin-protein ligase bre1 [Culicoides brevitarsis]|uniref:probable E3 ubiquitin-protein ligase bre1 n=1 Tax=Culicoides brevitarsis TaxID=469753 RepID=UPI00307B2EAF